MGRRAFQPTDEQRGNVEAMVGYGIPEDEICRLIKNPETGRRIDAKTLRKHFPDEIADGMVKVKSLVGNFIVSTILARGPGEKADWHARSQLAMFFARTRMSWKDTTAVEHSGTIVWQAYPEDEKL